MATQTSYLLKNAKPNPATVFMRTKKSEQCKHINYPLCLTFTISFKGKKYVFIIHRLPYIYEKQAFVNFKSCFTKDRTHLCQTVNSPLVHVVVWDIIIMVDMYNTSSSALSPSISYQIKSHITP